MDNLTIAAASGIRSRMQSLDLLANNLANSATSGYKRDQEFYGLFKSEEAQAAEGMPVSMLPVIQRQWTDFSQGTLQPTGNNLDLALNGKGFFVVNGPAGPLYTRNGALQVLPSGEIATSEGYPILDTSSKPITVVSGVALEISKDGDVRQNGETRGRIAVVNFPVTTALEKVGGTYFRNTDSKTRPVAAADVAVEQGRIEASNVPVAEAAMRLVGIMRQFEMLQKAIGVSGEMDTKTIQEVARVGG